MTGLKIGYARASTVGQDLTAQRDGLATLMSFLRTARCRTGNSASHDRASDNYTVSAANPQVAFVGYR